MTMAISPRIMKQIKFMNLVASMYHDVFIYNTPIAGQSFWSSFRLQASLVMHIIMQSMKKHNVIHPFLCTCMCQCMHVYQSMHVCKCMQMPFQEKTTSFYVVTNTTIWSFGSKITHLELQQKPICSFPKGTDSSITPGLWGPGFLPSARCHLDCDQFSFFPHFSHQPLPLLCLVDLECESVFQCLP